MKHLNEVTASLTAIPRKRLIEKVRGTIIGLAAIVGAVLFKQAGWFPGWFQMGLLIFGGFCISGDLVRGFAAFLPAAIRDIRAAIKGNG